jgi:hypothetical protein
MSVLAYETVEKYSMQCGRDKQGKYLVILLENGQRICQWGFDNLPDAIAARKQLSRRYNINL